MVQALRVHSAMGTMEEHGKEGGIHSVCSCLQRTFRGSMSFTTKGWLTHKTRTADQTDAWSSCSGPGPGPGPKCVKMRKAAAVNRASQAAPYLPDPTIPPSILDSHCSLVCPGFTVEAAQLLLERATHFFCRLGPTDNMELFSSQQHSKLGFCQAILFESFR